MPTRRICQYEAPVAVPNPSESELAPRAERAEQCIAADGHCEVATGSHTVTFTRMHTFAFTPHAHRTVYRTACTPRAHRDHFVFTPRALLVHTVFTPAQVLNSVLTRMGIVKFASATTLSLPLSHDPAAALAVFAAYSPNGGTYISAGLAKAQVAIHCGMSVLCSIATALSHALR